MTLQEAWNKGSEVLEQAGIVEAKLDAWYLLEHVTKIGRAMYYADSQKVMSLEEEKQFLFYITERSKRIPLQHLTGVQEFMGLEFLVTEHVLIPRQDTESLVEQAIDILKTIPSTEEKEVLDMCTGSGCILLSILQYVKGPIKGVGVDISGLALETAKKNADRLNLHADFLHSDLFDEVKGCYNMIVSNPPYIQTEVIQTLQEEVQFHDPYLALDGKEDGLYFYREIIAVAHQYLKQKGWLLFEIGFDQGEAVSRMMKDAGYQHVEVKKDLAGLDRIVLGMYDR